MVQIAERVWPAWRAQEMEFGDEPAGNFSFKTLVTVGVGPGDLGSIDCVAPFTDAVALVAQEGQGSAVDRAFFIMFN